MVLFSIMPASACAQIPAPAANFDDCLITHMAAISMLGDDATLRETLIASQTDLLRDDSLDADALAQRTSTLLQSYGRAAERSAAQAIANGTAPDSLAVNALSCGKALGR